MAQACRHPAAGVGTRGENAGLPAGFLPGWWSLVKIASVLTLLPAESTGRVPVAEPSHGISARLLSTTAVRSGWSCLVSVGAPGLGT